MRAAREQVGGRAHRVRKRDEIDQLTGNLRGNPDTLWPRLRALLADTG
jgi:hypothetical protein